MSLQFLVFGSARAAEQQEPGSLAQTMSTDSEIVVPPWCNWISNVPESIQFKPINSSGAEILDFIYDGSEQDLKTDTNVETFYVAGQDGLTTQAASNNCSWFNQPKVGAGVSFNLSGSTFQAYGRNPITGNFDTRDFGMDIQLDGDNPLDLSRTFQPICSSSGFDLGSTALSLFDSNSSANIPVVGLDPSLIATNNFCTATTQYSMKIPAGLTPLLSNTQYAWTGPTIVFTAMLSSDLVAAYTSLSSQDQSIDFNSPSDMTFTEPAQSLVATSSSDLAVTFTSNTPNVCEISSNNQVTQKSIGTCSISASQGGQKLFFNAAPSVTKTFAIINSVYSINFNQPANMNRLAPAQTLTASSSNGLGVSFRSNNSNCSISSNKVNQLVAGTCSITAFPTGNAYQAPEVTKTFTVSKVNQTITAWPNDRAIPLGNTYTYGVPTASSGLTVTIKNNFPNCTITSSTIKRTVKFNNINFCGVTFTQTGDSRYNAAPSKTTSYR